MKWIISLLACALPCMGQLTLENAHYPTLFKSSGSSPASGAVLWLTPDSGVFTDRLQVSNAQPGQLVNMWQDVSGNNNHVYFYSGLNASGGPFYTNNYTLNGKRILVFGNSCSLGGNFNKTGLITSNTITLNTGFTVFMVSSFLNPDCLGTTETAGCAWGYNGINLLFRRSQLGTDNWRTYHNASGVETVDGTVLGKSNYQAMAWMFSDTLNTNVLWRSNTIVNALTDNGAIPAAGTTSVGFRSDDGVSSHFQGGICELILYATNLTAVEITNTFTYLKAKYNL